MSLYGMTIPVFIQMLQSLSGYLDKAAAHAGSDGGKLAALPEARLAPDMHPLSKQVEIACQFAVEGVTRLTAIEAPVFAEAPATLETLKSRIGTTVAFLQGAPEAAFSGAAEREIQLAFPNGMAFVMTGEQFIRDWAMPQFYFHVVTAYGILRHGGVALGKNDYLNYAGKYMRPAPQPAG